MLLQLLGTDACEHQSACFAGTKALPALYVFKRMCFETVAFLFVTDLQLQFAICHLSCMLMLYVVFRKMKRMEKFNRQ